MDGGAYIFYLISIPLWYDYKIIRVADLCPNFLFQFHCDTIIRWNPFHERYFFFISIPLWYDYKQYAPIICFCLSQISIPLWYDYKCGLLMSFLHIDSISIPLWYDYKKFKDGLGLHYIQFQFHCDTIIRFAATVVSGSVAIFQFHCDTIISGLNYQYV